MAHPAGNHHADHRVGKARLAGGGVGREDQDFIRNVE